MSENQQKNKPFIDRAFDFFCSVKLSIFVLFALAVTSIIGTVIEQGKEPAHYVQAYGSTWGGIINAANFGDMYHAWWFTVLLALLMVNITFCSVKRLPAAIRQMTDKDPLFDRRDKPVAIHEKAQISVSESDTATVAEKVAEILGAKAGKTIRAEADGSYYLMGSKGGWSRMGVYVTHFSLFLFTLGALVGLMTGFKGAVNITEGTVAKEVYDRATRQMTPIDFQVRCDKFEVSYYPNSGRVKDYTSVLTVIDGGREVETKTIEVNDPLIYKGYYFYQSSYGKSGLSGAYVTVAGPDRNYLFTNTFLANGQRLRLPGNSELVIRDIWEDQTDSGAPAGLVFGIIGNGQLVGSGRAFEAAFGRPWWQVGQYQIRVDKIDWLEYTGLQVARDPGVPIVWAGCILITIGLMVSFFISHRRVWVKVAKADRGVVVSVAGNASRNRVSFETWFKGLCEEIQEGFEKKKG